VLIYTYGSEGRYLRRDEVEKAFAAQFAYFEEISGSDDHYVEDIYTVARRTMWDGEFGDASFRYFSPVNNIIYEWNYQGVFEVDGTIYPPVVVYKEYRYDPSTNTYDEGVSAREFVYDETNDRFNE
jgi:hypothetical protein